MDKSSDKKDEYYKVAFEYKADNNDELELIVGEYIKVIIKMKVKLNKSILWLF